MKTYLSNIIPELQRFSKRLDDTTLLTSKHWVVIDEISNSKTIYIFRNNQELLISNNGKVSKARWDYLGNSTLLIDIGEESYLFRHGFFDDNVLLLKLDNNNQFAYLVNETIYENNLKSTNSIDLFLKNKYLLSSPQPQSPSTYNNHNTSVSPMPKTISIQKTPTQQSPDYVLEQRILQVTITLLCLCVSFFLGKYCLTNITFKNALDGNNGVLIIIEITAIWGIFSFGKLLFEREV